MQKRLGIDEFDDELLKSFIRPETQRLWEEIEDPKISDYRRAEIGDRLAQIGDDRPGVGLDEDGLPDILWVSVPGGTVTLEDKENTTFEVEPFQMARYPITYRQYRAFFEADDGYFNDDWWQGLTREAAYGPDHWEQYRPIDNCPAETVDWYDAVAFCRWLSQKLGYEVTLPTEQQWQQAATLGRKDYEYPWGPEWQERHANSNESELGRTTSVGMYPQGQARFGDSENQMIDDLAGNVWEWCLNKKDKPKVITIDDSGDDRLLRGGSWAFNGRSVHSASRFAFVPGLRDVCIGFRLARGQTSSNQGTGTGRGDRSIQFTEPGGVCSTHRFDFADQH
jgi:formylglycine-generating enzyme required for sulfatase activity